MLFRKKLGTLIVVIKILIIHAYYTLFKDYLCSQQTQLLSILNRALSTKGKVETNPRRITDLFIAL